MIARKQSQPHNPSTSLVVAITCWLVELEPRGRVFLQAKPWVFRARWIGTLYPNINSICSIHGIRSGRADDSGALERWRPKTKQSGDTVETSSPSSHAPRRRLPQEFDASDVPERIRLSLSKLIRTADL